jgi:hypothetical protein
MIKLFINIASNDTNNQSVGFRTSLLISFLHNLTSKKANPPFFLGSSTSLSLSMAASQASLLLQKQLKGIIQLFIVSFDFFKLFIRVNFPLSSN